MPIQLRSLYYADIRRKIIAVRQASIAEYVHLYIHGGAIDVNRNININQFYLSSFHIHRLIP